VEENLGHATLGWMIWAVFAACAAGLLWLLRELPFRRLALLGLVALAGVAAASCLEVSVGRMHVVFYGVLGWLVSRDQRAAGFPAWPAVVALASIVPVFEEAFQGVLPDRVADVRDIFLGAGSTCWGALLHRIAGEGGRG
jgi:hypothetical protein